MYNLREILTSTKHAAGLILIAVLSIYLLSGIYIVKPGEQGVVRRFGKVVRVTSPGPHYHLPWPFEKVDTPSVTEVKRIEIGFRTIDPGPPARYQDVPHEALMLTGDENIVDIEMIVQYKIKDAPNYLFNVRDVEGTLRDASEAALRHVIGKTEIDDVLTVGKFRVQEETKALIQKIMDKYDSGVLITEVKLQDVCPPEEVVDAFKDVASAKEDKIRYINEAKAYHEDIIPKARGEAEKIIKEAEAYKEQRRKEAEGRAERFVKVLSEYNKAKGITRKNLYLETMEEIFPEIKKFIIDKEASGGILNLLPLTEELKR
jgi:membrane protease subunit HflK